jgi:hypothetical protein
LATPNQKKYSRKNKTKQEEKSFFENNNKKNKS